MPLLASSRRLFGATSSPWYVVVDLKLYGLSVLEAWKVQPFASSLAIYSIAYIRNPKDLAGAWRLPELIILATHLPIRTASFD